VAGGHTEAAVRTLVGAADRGPGRPLGYSVTFTSTANAAGGYTVVDEVHVWDWVPTAAPAPYRTTAQVGEPIREIEP
jgi:hypothetical protein